MTKNNTNSHKGFNYSILGIGLILISIVLTYFLNTFASDLASILIGVVAFAIGITSVIGFSNSLKGIKEPNTAKKIIGIIVNFGIVVLFLYVIISNGYDIYRVLLV